MKRSNVWRDPAGNLWEVRDGEVGYDLASYVVLADRTVWSHVVRTTPFHQTISSVAQEAWEILIGDPLPALRKFWGDVPKPYHVHDGITWRRKGGGVVSGPDSAPWFVTESGHVVCDGSRHDNRPDWALACARVRDSCRKLPQSRQWIADEDLPGFDQGVVG